MQLVSHRQDPFRPWHSCPSKEDGMCPGPVLVSPTQNLGRSAAAAPKRSMLLVERVYMLEHCSVALF